jgi:hypothetical protein
MQDILNVMHTPPAYNLMEHLIGTIVSMFGEISSMSAHFGTIVGPALRGQCVQALER